MARSGALLASMFAATCAPSCSEPQPPPPARPAEQLVQPAPAAPATEPRRAPPPSPARASTAPANPAALVPKGAFDVPACTDSHDAFVFSSPRSPWSGAPLRILPVTEKPVGTVVAVRDPAGRIAAASATRRGGPPYWWLAEIRAPAPGSHRVVLLQDDTVVACRDLVVGEEPPEPPEPSWTGIWRNRAAWNRATENLYSAWIEKLFDDPLDAQPSWPALHDVLRDPSRNVLHNHLGADEDARNVAIDPDCADLPYFLRAYFAFKLGLPFGFSECSRGGEGAPPECSGFRSNRHAKPKKRDPMAAFGEYLRTTVADTVHSGTGRAPATDDATDYYPVRLTEGSLRPGTIYADPYGHVLVVTSRVPQAPGSSGILLAIDGQPDGTVARKRFWRGNFLFADDPALGSPGFKRFRPIAVERGVPRPLSNAEIASHPDYGDFGLDQYEGGVDAFYDRVDDVLSPEPVEPLRAMLEAVQALHEQVETRVGSVENGERFVARGTRIDMPKGAAIFETVGPWEDFSTPSRDLRLLIAIDVVRTFPERVARRPGRYAMPAGKPTSEVRAALETALQKELAARRFTYRRSDGSPFTLTLADVLARAAALEMGYNPNDCVEIRWGAEEGSEEASTCRRRAPGAQLARMRRYRAWFRERRRPPRGFSG